MVNRNDATRGCDVGGTVVFRGGQFSPRRLRAEREVGSLPAGGWARRRSEPFCLTWPGPSKQRREKPLHGFCEPASTRSSGRLRAGIGCRDHQAGGVSVGALFRHFERWVISWRPRHTSVAPSAGNVRNRRRNTGQSASASTALTILQDITAGSTNRCSYELMVAARTDEALKEMLQNVLG